MVGKKNHQGAWTRKVTSNCDSKEYNHDQWDITICQTSTRYKADNDCERRIAQGTEKWRRRTISKTKRTVSSQKVSKIPRG